MQRAFKLTAFGQPLQPVDCPLPEPQGTEVLLKIGACGVCHSDLHLWEGFFDLGNDKKLPFGGGGKILPLTLGHEIVGTVAAVGKDAVSEAKIGDRRLVFPWIGCGTCATCKAGQEHICQGQAKAIGIFVNGGYSTHVLVPHPRYLLDFSGIPDDLASTYACSGLTAYSALRKIGPLQAGDPLLIIGAGGVGLNGVRFARAITGVAPIVADIDPAKRQAALAAGAAEALDPAADGALKGLLKATGGVAGAVDFAGTTASFNFGYGALRKGGHLVAVGLLGGAPSIPLVLLAMRSVRISGSYVGSLAELQDLIDLTRRVGMQPMPISRRPLDQVNEALADLKAGRVVGRMVLTP